jgi:YD repeat-containing protein
VPSPSSQAEQTGVPVAIVGDRTQTSSTYATPAGGFQTVIGTGSINYLDAQGSWQPINDTLVADPSAGYSLINTANRYQAEFPTTLASAPVKVSVGGAWLAFSLNGATGTLSSSGSSATYANALSGVNVEYQAQADSVKETLVLASDAAPPAYSFAVSASSGVSLTAQGNQIQVSHGGTSIGELAAPTLSDAAGVSGPISMSLASTGSGWTVTVTPDAGWLAAPGRLFPVTVDPTVNIGASGSSCYIGPSSASGCESVVISGSGGTEGVTRGLVSFVLPASVPDDAVVTQAALSAYDGDSSAMSVAVERLTQAWDPDQSVVSWTQATSGVNWTTAGGSFDSTTPAYQASGYVSAVPAATISTPATPTWYPTQMVQDWLSYQAGSSVGHPNLGFLLKQPNESNSNGAAFNGFGLTVTWKYRWGPTGSIKLHNQAINDKATLGVQVANDNAVLSNNDLSIAGTGENLTVARYYNSEGLTGGAAWSFSVGPDVSLVADGSGSLTAREPGGAHVAYAKTPSLQGHCVYGGTSYSSYYITPPGADATLCALSSGYVVTSNSSQSSLLFGTTANSGSSLSGQIDRNGDTITYNYNTSGYLSSMVDTQGRTFNVTEDATTHKINQISGPVGATGAQLRTWGYSWASNGQLNYYTDPTGQVTHYNYDANGNLSKVLSPGTYISGTLTVSETDIAQTAGGQVTTVSRQDPSCPSGSCTTSYYTVPTPSRWSREPTGALRTPRRGAPMCSRPPWWAAPRSSTPTGTKPATGGTCLISR